MSLVTIWATILVVLCIYNGSSVASPSSAPLVKLASYHINKKPIHTVSDKFLSFTADPNTISHVAECSLTNATLVMTKSLAPAYFRLAGIDSNRFVFQSNPNINNTELTSKSKTFPVSNTEWLKLNNFLSKTGMSVVVCLSAQAESTNKGWDLSNTLELITYSDKHNISLDWQLGYELQKLASPQGKLMGRDVTRLRKILDVFPRYRNSLIIGPDMTSFKSQNDAMFVRSYLAEAGDSLNVFTWHPFSKSSEDNEILEMLANGMNSMDNYLWIKDGLMKSSSKGVVPKKSIWIAESENTETISNLTDSMTWIKRMGTAARLGVSVYLRKPHLLSFYEPTPEYWTAILYKSLVGRTVLDIKQTSGNGTNKVQMFTHCTKFIDKPDESIINPEISYDPGSITVYGVNMASESTRISFKIGYKGDETAHLYVLTEDASGDFPKTLLNKQFLDLSAENELPVISPRIRESPKYVLIPGRSIFFVVFPNTKCRSCNEFDSPDASKSKTKIFEEESDQDLNTFTSNVLEVTEDENDHESTYVSYPKRAEHVSQMDTDSTASSLSDLMNQSNSQSNVKYVTFSEETWLNPFPEKFKDIVNKEKDGTALNTNDQKKAAMYRTLAQAMLGKRPSQNIAKELPKVDSPTTRFLFEDDSESNQFKRALNKSPSRTRRASELESVPENRTESRKDLEESIVRGKDDDISLKSDSQLSPANKTESQDGSQELFGDDKDDEQTFKSISEIFSSDDINFSQSIALYLFDQENETRTLETNANSSFPETYSKINAVLLNDENIEQAMNSTEWNQTVPVITFVQRSAFENIIKAFNNRIKREVIIENGIIPEMSDNSTTTSSCNTTQSSNSSSSQTPLSEETPSVTELLNNILNNTIKLMQNLFPSNSINSNQTQTNINRLLAKAMLTFINAKNSSKKSTTSENPPTRFVLKDDTQSDAFQEALKNFDRFRRSSESTLESKDDLIESFMEVNDMTEPEQKIIKREGNIERSPILKSPVAMDSPDIALYLFEQQDDETRSFETQKRSTRSRIYAVPLNEDNLQMAMENPKFKETIPIVTFVRKPTLEGMVEAAQERSKREAPKFENSTISEVCNNLTVTSTPSSSNYSKQSDDKLVASTSKQMVEESGKIIQQFSPNITKNESSITPMENLKNATFSPELSNESDSSEMSRELREIVDKLESTDNDVGVQRIKMIDKPNLRPVSPFPKKPKNVKSKPTKNIKSKSTDNVQLNHQNIPSTSSPSTEPSLSTKRSTPQIISSNQDKSADLVENQSSDDLEDSLSEDSAVVTKFQTAISKNLEEPNSQTEVKQSKDVSSKVQTHSPLENTHAHQMLGNAAPAHPSNTTVNSETVGIPQKKPSLADLARKAQRPQLKNKPKMTPEQLRTSYQKKRKELLQKHIARVNELRSLIGIPVLPEIHIRKREANIFEDWYRESSNVLSDWWKNLQNWEPENSWIAKETAKISDAITGRSKRQNDEDITEQYPSPALEIFKSNRFKRNSDIVTSPRKIKETPQQLRDLLKARNEERRRQNDKISEQKKAMKTQAKDTHIRHRRDLQDKIEKARELKQMNQIRLKEHRQKVAKRVEELKQKLATHTRHRRDLQEKIEKARDLKEMNQKRLKDHRQKVTKRIEELKQRLAHLEPNTRHRNKRNTEERPVQFQNIHKKPTQKIQKKTQHESSLPERNKRDVQTIQNKVNELRKKKQEHRQELHKKSQEVEHPAEQPVTPAPTKMKSNPDRIDDHHAEQPATPASAKIKTKPEKIDQHHAEQPATPVPIKLKPKPDRIDDHHAENPATPASPKIKTKPAKIDQPRHQVDKTKKKSPKPLPINETPHRIRAREVNENQLEEKLAPASDLQKNLKFRLFVDPELNTPQSMLEDDKFDELDHLKRSITNNENNEIADDDYETGTKNKNKDHENYKYSNLNKLNDLIHASSTSTSNPLNNMKTGDSRIKSNVSQETPSQENQTCQLTDYNVFKYLWCVAHRLWNNYFSI